MKQVLTVNVTAHVWSEVPPVVTGTQLKHMHSCMDTAEKTWKSKYRLLQQKGCTCWAGSKYAHLDVLASSIQMLSSCVSSIDTIIGMASDCVLQLVPDTGLLALGSS